MRDFTSKIVTHELDAANPPPLTEAQKTEIAAPKARSQGEIGTSGILEPTDRFRRDAVRNPFFRPVKQQLMPRLGADLFAWFKRHAKDGKGCQTGINRTLRAYVDQQQKEAG